MCGLIMRCISTQACRLLCMCPGHETNKGSLNQSTHPVCACLTSVWSNELLTSHVSW